MRRVVKAVVAVLVLGAFVGTAAASQTILGKSFVVKDPKPGLDPSKRKVVALGKELASPNTVIGDPVGNGATIQIIANGGVNSSQTFSLPAGAHWTAINGGFKYVDKLGADGPVKTVIIKKAPSNAQFLVKAVIVGLLGPITVLPPHPGTDGGMILTIPGGDSYCVAFGGAAGGLIVNSADKLFKGVSTATLPTNEAGCPSVAVTTTTATTTSTTTSTLAVSFAADVQPIFTARCALAGCHVTPFPQGALDLSAGTAYGQLVNFTTATVICPLPAGVKRVAPGNAPNSYLIQKLNGFGPCFQGLQMPALPPLLTPTEQGKISSWILQGAPNN